MLCGEELSQNHTRPFQSLRNGYTTTTIGPIVFDEMFRIAREALVNAFRHSEASKIEVELTYSSAHCLFENPRRWSRY